MLEDAKFVGFVPVRSLDAARAFYCDVLGLEFREQDAVALMVGSGGVTIRLTEVADFRPQAFTIAGWVVDDISYVITSLANAGVPMNRYEGMPQDELGVWTAPSGDRVAWFNDQDGNVLSVTSIAL